MKLFAIWPLRILLCSLLWVGSPLVVFGQSQEDRPVAISLVTVQGGVHVPAGDLADRFGVFGTVGGGYQYKFRSNWLLGITGDFLFGPTVKEDSLLRGLLTNDGFLIGLDGAQYNPILYLRGYRFQLTVGKILPVWQRNPNSGLLVNGTVGFLQHKIYYDVKQRDNLPQISKENIKGYDRLSNGWVFTGFVGYHHMSPSRLVNYQIGLEYQYAATKLRRTANYDGEPVSDVFRADQAIGFRATWILPLYRKRSIDYNKYFE